jgi:preprotein translocase subunit SecA
MTIMQTIDIPPDRRITLDVPPQIPVGKTQLIIQFPDNASETEAVGHSGNENFRKALRRAYGAWKDNPWTNHLEDVNAMREEWEHRDPWNVDPLKKRQD